GGTAMSDCNITKQKLTLAEEDVLVNYLLESAIRGFPLTLGELYQEANMILKSKYRDDYELVGENWAS
ncbi:hypothetical protein SERLA73DRAFT_18298, partial [Serpula lacrymans var. lacrymans S7.3]